LKLGWTVAVPSPLVVSLLSLWAGAAPALSLHLVPGDALPVSESVIQAREHTLGLVVPRRSLDGCCAASSTALSRAVRRASTVPLPLVVEGVSANTEAPTSPEATASASEPIAASVAVALILKVVELVEAVEVASLGILSVVVPADVGGERLDLFFGRLVPVLELVLLLPSTKLLELVVELLHV